MLEELQKALAKEENRLKACEGKAPRVNREGPVNLELVRAIIAVVEAQDKENEELRRRVNTIQSWQERRPNL